MPPRNVSTVLATAVLSVLAGGGCIRRTAPPPATPGAAPTAAAPSNADNAASAALAAANERIARVPRVDLLGGGGLNALAVQGENAKAVAVTTVPVSGQPFAEATRVEIKEASSHEWAVQLAGKTAAPVESGDAILATFYLHTETPQEGSVGETELVFELASAPYTKSVQYPVQGSSDWAKVQVRFTAARAYAAGEAQVIFRLGYEPEVLQIAGLTVESFGKRVPLSTLPSTLGADKRRERAAAETARLAASAPSAPVEGGELQFEVAPSRVIRAISPYVYGINSQKDKGLGITVRRMGGNRQTGYNWENNASNAGSDYQQSSDDWPCTSMGYRDCDKPGAQFLDFVASNKAMSVDSLVTVPMVDYVTGDKKGTVTEKQAAPSPRWNRSYPQKRGPLSLTPDLTDGNVYQDEFVNLLVQKLGTADKGGVRFYSLDNEPALWPSTHPRIHPEKTRYQEMVTRTEATASAITKLDPTAEVLGAVAFGWSEYMSLQDAPDAAEHAAQYPTYLDFFLGSMKHLEDEYHRRLVHVLDIHWYPEAKGAKRITDKDNSPKTVAARLQAVRSLWDPTYVEKSWIAATWGKPIRLIPWLQEKIAERYPGTKLSMTEYDFGGGEHISGGLAQADVLGVLGREGMYLANYWGNGPGNGNLPPYIKAAFVIFRNYDGNGGTYGDTAVAAKPADLAKASIFAATDSKRSGKLTILVINKEQHTTFNGRIDLKEVRDGTYSKADVFTFDASSPDVRALAAVDVKGNRIAYRLPPLSATLFVCH
jgi:hypothetical protein